MKKGKRTVVEVSDSVLGAHLLQWELEEKRSKGEDGYDAGNNIISRLSSALHFVGLLA